MGINNNWPTVVRTDYDANKSFPQTRARALEIRDWHFCHPPFFANFSEVSGADTSWATLASVSLWLPGWLATEQFYLAAYIEGYVSGGDADWRLSHAGANGSADTVTATGGYALTGKSVVAAPQSGLRARYTVNVQMQSTGGDTLTIRSQNMTWRWQTSSG